MASKHRERKIIASVACPDCGAPLGVLCRRDTRPRADGLPALPQRPMLCAGRRTAWQMIRDGEITDGQ